MTGIIPENSLRLAPVSWLWWTLRFFIRISKVKSQSNLCWTLQEMGHAVTKHGPCSVNLRTSVVNFVLIGTRAMFASPPAMLWFLSWMWVIFSPLKQLETIATGLGFPPAQIFRVPCNDHRSWACHVPAEQSHRCRGTDLGHFLVTFNWFQNLPSGKLT